jgi:hypothetical protein
LSEDDEEKALNDFIEHSLELSILPPLLSRINAALSARARLSVEEKRLAAALQALRHCSQDDLHVPVRESDSICFVNFIPSVSRFICFDKSAGTLPIQERFCGRGDRTELFG